MNEQQRLHLQRMVSENNVEDMTGLIRELKHSAVLRADTQRLLELKASGLKEEALNMEAMLECNFLFSYYTDVYNKIRKDELNLDVWDKALDVLQKIEDGTLDQHEGAFQFGTLIKQVYVDSALRKQEKLAQEYREQSNGSAASSIGPKTISWSEFKAIAAAHQTNKHKNKKNKKPNQLT